MKWAEMSEDERNLLVHSKVMGRTAESCTAPQYYGDKQEIVVRCEGCGYEFPENDITSHNEYGPDAYPIHADHNVPIPHYTTSMDAAWQVVEKLGRFTLDYCPETLYPCEATYIRSDDMGRQALAKTMPEAICKAALRAIGEMTE